MAVLRFFYPFISGLVLVAGCGGSSNSGLFGPITCGDAGCPATDPSNPGDGADAGTRRDSGHDAASLDAATGGPCRRDIECDTGLCNLSIDRCAVPAADGAPCRRDSECAGALCNLSTDACSSPAPDGAACRRDAECAGALCNLSADKCLPKQPAGQECRRDSECASNLCNLATDTCK